MEALTIVAGSLLFGLIFLLASERQISNSRKHRTHDPKDDDFLPLDRSRGFDDDDSYSDIFKPRKGRSSRLKKIPDLDYGSSFNDDDFPLFERKENHQRSNRSRRQNPVNSYINFMAIVILGFLVLKYFEFI